MAERDTTSNFRLLGALDKTLVFQSRDAVWKDFVDKLSTLSSQQAQATLASIIEMKKGLTLG